MNHIDTLKTYDDLVNSGVPTSQARAHVHALDSSFDSVVTRKDLSIMEQDLKIFLGGEMALLFIFSFFLPLILKRFGWVHN